MNGLTTHNTNTAPAASQPLIEKSIQANGRLPGLHAILAESPELFEAYQTLHKLFTSSTLDAEQLTVVWQTINVEHGCTYCVPAHTGIANMMKVDPALTEALRNKQPLPTAKLQALQDATLSIVRNRGNISEAEVQTFYSAGYTPRNLLEIILGLSQKVISNYTNHIAQTPVDKVFEKFAWSPEI